jgi:hypothetical protein
MVLKLVNSKELPSRYPTLIAAILGLWGVWLAARKSGMPWFKRAAMALRQTGHARMIDDHLNPGENYLHRHFIVGDDFSKGIRILIHEIHKSDQDGLHDHPWPFISWGLEGLYKELAEFGFYIRKAGRFYFRGSRSFHRVQLVPERWNKTVWTCIVTFPRMPKSWGFLTKIGNKVKWVHWNTWLKSS